MSRDKHNSKHSVSGLQSFIDVRPGSYRIIIDDDGRIVSCSREPFIEDVPVEVMKAMSDSANTLDRV